MWSLLGLTTIAMTQPLLDLVGRNTAFLVAHDVGRLDLLVMTAALAFGVPLTAAAVVLLVRRLHPPAGTWLHDGLIIVTVAMAVLVMSRVGGVGAHLPGAVELAVGACAGLAAAIAYHRASGWRRLLSLTALAAPVVVLFFLLATPVSGLLLPASGEGDAVSDGGPLPPVVIVVFDELPLSSLLDEQYQLDATNFPNFGALARDATFFRNATASHASTVEAVPALLSGRYTKVNTLPTGSAHPTNIFSLLEQEYRLHALEPLTDLCGACRDDAAAGRGSQAAAVARDVGILQLHLTVPDDWAGRLPPIDSGWRDFGGQRTETLDREQFLEDAREALRENTAGDFRRFTRGITRKERPGLHVLHTLLPHRPWRYLPDGRRHFAVPREPSQSGDSWVGREWPVAQSQQLHLAQTQFADRLLGRLVRQLRQEDLYDDALLVVAADHGLSLVPGTPIRTLSADSLREIAPVPLLVKTPGQTRGEISDRAVETVDVLPTILDVLEMEFDASLDGRSALDPTSPARTTKALIDQEGTTWEFDTSQDPLFATTDRKIELFGAGASFDLYGLAPPVHGRLLGRPVPSATAGAKGLGVAITRAGAFEHVHLEGHGVPAVVSGRVTGLDPTASLPTVAVAVNGIVAAVTVADTGDKQPRGSFRALVPPASFRESSNDVAVYLVDESGALLHIGPDGPE